MYLSKNKITRNIDGGWIFLSSFVKFANKETNQKYPYMSVNIFLLYEVVLNSRFSQ